MLRTPAEIKQNGIVFLTGANGYIGATVAQHLIAHGFTVLGLVRTQEGAAMAVANGVLPVIGNLSDKAVVRQAVDQSDAIVHTASAGPLPDGDLRAMIERSVEAIAFLRDLSKEKSIRLVVTSGASMYGDTSQAPAREETKLPEEGFFAELSTLENSLEADENIIILRASLVYGRGASKPLLASIGPMYDAGSLFMAGQGHKVTVVHVDDLAALYVKALTEKEVLPVLLGASEVVETKAILLALADNLGMSDKIEEISPERARQEFSVLGHYSTVDMQLDPSLTQKHLGWQPARSGIIEDIREGSYRHVLGSNLPPYSEKLTH